MATWECLGCTALYSVGAERCPECGSTDHREEGADMAKLSRAGGPSYEGVTENVDAGTFATSAGLGGTVTPQQAVEGYRDEPASQADTEQHAADDAEQYDPADYTVNEVNAYLDECRDEENQAEFDRVMHAEQAGRNRTGIVNRASGG